MVNYRMVKNVLIGNPRESMNNKRSFSPCLLFSLTSFPQIKIYKKNSVALPDCNGVLHVNWLLYSKHKWSSFIAL